MEGNNNEGNGLSVDKMIADLTESYGNLDKARIQAEKSLLEAANKTIGADVFESAGFLRHGMGIDIHLKAFIPYENPCMFDRKLEPATLPNQT
jgi:hypothetical protein